MAYVKKPSNKQKKKKKKRAKENENAAYEMIKGIAEGYKKIRNNWLNIFSLHLNFISIVRIMYPSF